MGYSRNKKLIGITLTGEASAPIVVRNLDEMDTDERAAQVQKLQKAINALTVDTSDLESALEKAAAVNEILYTAESYAKLEETVEAGKALLNSSSTEQEVAQAAQAILDAIDALVSISSSEGWDGTIMKEPMLIGGIASVQTAEELACKSMQEILKLKRFSCLRTSISTAKSEPPGQKQLGIRHHHCYGAP